MTAGKMTAETECLDNARDCVRLLHATSDPDVRNDLLEMARSWMATALHEGPPVAFQWWNDGCEGVTHQNELQEHLVLAETLVSRATLRVAEQRERLDRLERGNYDPMVISLARQTLSQFEELQGLRLADRHRLLWELGFFSKARRGYDRASSCAPR